MITSMTCVNTSIPNEIIDVSIELNNSSGTVNTYALLFCASTTPHTTCNILQILSNAFILQPTDIGSLNIKFVMPNEPIAYIATLQKWDIISNTWIEEGLSKSCITDITIEESEPNNTLLYVTAAIAGLVGLYFITKKK